MPKELNTAKKIFEKLLSLPAMSTVEKNLTAQLHSSNRQLDEITNYTLTAGGKRIRPAICLVCAALFNSEDNLNEVIDAATVVELIHQASLLHDDIIDNAPLRRNKPSIVSKFGLNNALLSGDFLYLKAFALCKNFDSVSLKKIEDTCQQLIEGETFELNLEPREFSLSNALLIAQKKTAALFELAAFLGAYFVLTKIKESNRIKESEQNNFINNLCSFGNNLGTAFQILDDILDVTSNELGKTPGIDLQERKPSVINALWLESNDPLSKKLLTPLSSDKQSAFISEAIEHINSGGIIKKAYSLADNYLKQAQQSLDHIPINPINNNAKELLAAIINTALERTN